MPMRCPLPHAQVPAAFADRVVVTARQLANELVCLRAFGGFDDLGLGCIGPSVGDVFPHRGRKKERVLQHQADLCPQRLLGDGAQVLPVEQHAPGGGIIETRHQ